MKATVNALPASESFAIPLNLLVVSPRNVRKTGGTNIETLAASIQAHGLIQNLTVTPKGKKFEVIAGGRRLRALQHLAKNKTIGADYEVRCEVRKPGEASEISTAENVVREAMNPADQLDAFKALIDAGQCVEEVAARFGVSPAVVTQRLKLANLAPKLIEEYREGHATLDQLMALALTEDHAAQLAAWGPENAGQWQRRPEALRSAITRDELPSSNKLVRFVTLAAYEAAGGLVRRDLFGGDGDAFVIDVDLLNTLVYAKLEARAAKVRKEGWAWVEARTSFDYQDESRFRSASGLTREPDAKESKALAKLDADIQALEDRRPEGNDDEDEALDDAITAQIWPLEAKIETIRKGLRFNQDDPAVKAVAGAIVTINHNGTNETKRGLIRSAEYKAAYSAVTGRTDAKAITGDTAGEDKPTGGHSDALLRRLTAHRTVAARSLLAANPHVALVATVHALGMSLFYPMGHSRGYDAGTVLSVSASNRARLFTIDGIEDCEASKTLDALTERAKASLPAEPSALWGWLLERKTDELLNLLAVCVAPSVDLMMAHRRDHNDTGTHLGAGEPLVKALGLDMADFWKPTADSYLASVAKPTIAEAVTEQLGAAAAEPLAKMKKGEAVAAAEALLVDTRWLPAPLR